MHFSVTHSQFGEWTAGATCWGRGQPEVSATLCGHNNTTETLVSGWAWSCLRPATALPHHACSSAALAGSLHHLPVHCGVRDDDAAGHDAATRQPKLELAPLHGWDVVHALCVHVILCAGAAVSAEQGAHTCGATALQRVCAAGPSAQDCAGSQELAERQLQPPLKELAGPRPCRASPPAAAHYQLASGRTSPRPDDLAALV